jgi:hypothetical protein
MAFENYFQLYASNTQIFSRIVSNNRIRLPCVVSRKQESCSFRTCSALTSPPSLQLSRVSPRFLAFLSHPQLPESLGPTRPLAPPRSLAFLLEQSLLLRSLALSTHPLLLEQSRLLRSLALLTHPLLLEQSLLLPSLASTTHHSRLQSPPFLRSQVFLRALPLRPADPDSSLVLASLQSLAPLRFQPFLRKFKQRAGIFGSKNKHVAFESSR